MFRLSIVVLVKFIIVSIGLALIGCVAYFWFSMVVGGTYNLKKNIESVKGVEGISDYKLYEGRAFFQIELTGGGVIRFSGFKNTSLDDLKKINVEMVDGKEITCKSEDGSLFSKGMKADVLMRDIMLDSDKSAFQEVIDNYYEIVSVVGAMPKKYRGIKGMGDGVSRVWICYAR